jgi:ankyrin repeat protein
MVARRAKIRIVSVDPILRLAENDPLAIATGAAIRGGDVDALERLLSENPGLATARIVDKQGGARTLLHVAADWPGHFPQSSRTVSLLIAAGADPNARMTPHPQDPNCRETPLHWAASSNDVAVLDALLDGGADIEAPGAIFTAGSPMSDAVVFAQWNAARRLMNRGARTTLWQAAALGLLDRVKGFCTRVPAPSSEEITNAFWNACRGGELGTAEYLFGHGADANWIGHERKTPLQAAEESGNHELITWLHEHGARTTGAEDAKPL